ncbi:MAG: FecR family protein, partial [Candidatus Altiarchaeota archaeon]|nr:FecR family protein [Candidatus Altiarchaeota archaeon]
MMVTKINSLIVGLIVCFCLISSFTAADCPFTGEWNPTGEKAELGDMVLAQKGTVVTGTATAFEKGKRSSKITGTVKGDTLTGKIMSTNELGKPEEFDMTLTISGDCKSLKGESRVFLGESYVDLDLGSWTIKGGAIDSGVRFIGINGQVEYCVPPSDCSDYPDNYDFVQISTVLPVGAHVRTGADSEAIVGFVDMSTFVLKSNSEAVVASPPEKDTRVKMIRGDIWATFKKMVKDGSMDIEMNQAVAGIKGTTLVLSETGTKSSVKVIEGTIEFTNKADGKKVEISTGQQASVTDNQMSPITTFDIAQESAKW